MSVLLQEPSTQALLRSLRAAAPLLADPLAALAHGTGRDAATTAKVLNELQEQGVLLGLRGEPNPGLPAAKCSYALTDKNEPLPDGCIVRWETTGTAVWSGIRSLQSLSAQPPGDCVVASVVKCGFPLLLPSEVEKPLEASRDRTLLVGPVVSDFVPASHAELVLGEAWLQPRLIDWSGDIWSSVGKVAGLGAAEARASVQRLIMGGIWRRFHAALSPERLGYHGCGIALWGFGGKAGEAATSLAGLRAVAEVALLSAGPSGADTMTLWLGREPGSGEWAAREVGRQWGAKLLAWIPAGGLVPGPVTGPRSPNSPGLGEFSSSVPPSPSS